MTAIFFLALSFAQLPDLRQAWDLGRSNDERQLQSFNSGYQLSGSDLVKNAEVVTEFRRAVLIVRDRATAGELAFSLVDLAKAMKPYEGKLTFIVEVQLNPMHTFTAPPAYELYISTGRWTKPAPPKPFKREPVYGFTPGPGLAAPLVGLRLEGTYSRAEIEAGNAAVLTLVDEKANLLWQAPIDLARYR